MLFCRQLATLLSAGTTILKSLEVISKQVSSQRLYNSIQDIQKSMIGGTSFHEAMAKHPKIFSDLWVNIIESGEASGSLALVLERLASYLERESSFKKKVVSAMVYPAILGVASLGALLFLTIKIIPTFATIFAGFDMELPVLTQILIVISNFVRKFFLIILAGGIVGSFFFKKYISTTEGRKQFERFKFKLPVLGDFFRVLIVERFSSTMSTLLESGVPILYSLEIAEHSVGNLVVSDMIAKAKESVREGKTMGVSLDKFGFFDPMVIQMISIGEEIGELPNMFKRLNMFYQEFVETFLTRITALFEPVMLIFMAFVIGAMVVGMFLPIFQLSQISAG